MAIAKHPRTAIVSIDRGGGVYDERYGWWKETDEVDYIEALRRVRERLASDSDVPEADCDHLAELILNDLGFANI